MLLPEVRYYIGNRKDFVMNDYRRAAEFAETFNFFSESLKGGF
ncbi:hypothetical protein D3OALGA1CA_1133 [Olavius algarvensis associated proteobacterium Delta 3]|nr:hypothetical protein D3OALGB2SA_1140 [Olavius algarvensis associated proteobacterium Delta 3]CAB5094819.1 hypothetical protein D3OALGA1CA_1133 [Olavius algarvensis associated proteobacterium Delta 3]